MLRKAGTVPLMMKWEDSPGKGNKTLAHFHDDSHPTVKVREPREGGEMVIIASYLVESPPAV